MPIYCYYCPNCDKYFESLRFVSEGHLKVCPDCGAELDRDYTAEVPAMIADWPPGFNASIWEPYSNKKDLLEKIRRRGLVATRYGGGVTRAKSGLYGDEEYRDRYKPSAPEPTELKAQTVD